MTHEEMIALIRAAVPRSGGTWADLGAGDGNFTRALGAVVGSTGTLYAVDRDIANRPSIAGVHWLKADFTLPMELPILDGILMANALHFVKDQVAAIAHICGYLRHGGRFVLVEYDLKRPVSYVPYPVPFERFERLAQAAGLNEITRVSERRSPSTGITMYAGCGVWP